MKLNVTAVNFEIAERLEKYIEKKTRRYEKLLSPSAELEIRMTVVKPETNLNKETAIRILGMGVELYAQKVCDSFEQGIDECLEALDKQLEKQKNMGLGIADSKTLLTFALAKTKWEVLYGQLLVNPPGLDRSKGSRS